MLINIMGRTYSTGLMGDDRNLYIAKEHISAIRGNGPGRSLIYIVGNNFPAFEVEGDLEDVAEAFDSTVTFRLKSF